MIHILPPGSPEGSHYAIADNGKWILLQIQNQFGDQARIQLTPQGAQELIDHLQLIVEDYYIREKYGV